MKCPICNTELFWKSHYDMLEDSDGELFMGSNYDCPNEDCGVWIEIIYPNKENEDA